MKIIMAVQKISNERRKEMSIRAIIFKIIFTILAFLLLLNGEHEMCVLACIYARVISIEDKLEGKK